MRIRGGRLREFLEEGSGNEAVKDGRWRKICGKIRN